jgi:hypothetical protein
MGSLALSEQPIWPMAEFRLSITLRRLPQLVAFRPSGLDRDFAMRRRPVLDPELPFACENMPLREPPLMRIVA